MLTPPDALRVLMRVMRSYGLEKAAARLTEPIARSLSTMERDLVRESFRLHHGYGFVYHAQRCRLAYVLGAIAWACWGLANAFRAEAAGRTEIANRWAEATLFDLGTRVRV